MKRSGCALATLSLVLAAGCATSTPTQPGSATAPAGSPPPVALDPVDPWENFNRKVFAFNEALDTAVLKPVAEGYRKVVPALARTGVSNVFGNVYDVWSTANQLLQGKVQYGLDMGMRVLTNSLFGIGGLLDPATEMGLVRRSADFGQTLGRWGIPSGPYLVLPLFGPSTVRDGVGLVVDRSVSPSRLTDSVGEQYFIAALEVTAIRTDLLDAGTLLDQVALDKYSFLRDAYLARRSGAAAETAPPMETFDDEADPMPEPKPGEAKPAASAASAPAAAAPPASAASR